MDQKDEHKPNEMSKSVGETVSKQPTSPPQKKVTSPKKKLKLSSESISVTKLPSEPEPDMDVIIHKSPANNITSSIPESLSKIKGCNIKPDFVKHTQQKDAISTELKTERKKGRLRKKAVLKTVLDQMEFYFSDSNLRKDRYLKQLYDRSEDGFVDLTFFGNFNKLQSLQKDGVSLNFLCKALEKSTFLELNEEGTKVKRRTPLVQLDQKEIDKRTVYVEYLPRHATHSWVEKMFSQSGKVCYVSLPTFKTTKQIKGFAFVEFESPDEADKACKMLNNPPAAKIDEKPGKFPKGNKTLNRLQKFVFIKPEEDQENEENTTMEVKEDQDNSIANKKKKKKKAKKRRTSDSGLEECPEKKDKNQEVKKKKKKKKKKQLLTSDLNVEEEDNCVKGEDIESDCQIDVKETAKSVKVESESQIELKETGKGVKVESESQIELKETGKGVKVESESQIELKETGKGVKIESESQSDIKEGGKREESIKRKKIMEDVCNTDNKGRKEEMEIEDGKKETEECSSKKKRKKNNKKKSELSDRMRRKRERQENIRLKKDKEQKNTEAIENISEMNTVESDSTASQANTNTGNLKRKRESDVTEEAEEEPHKLRRKDDGSKLVPSSCLGVDKEVAPIFAETESSFLPHSKPTSRKRKHEEDISDGSEMEGRPVVRRKSDGSELMSCLVKSKRQTVQKRVEFNPVPITQEFIKRKDVRRRKKVKRDSLHLRVITKKEWLSLKKEFIVKQKSHMSALKKSLRKLRQQDEDLNRIPEVAKGKPHVDLTDVFGTKRLKPSMDVKMAHLEKLKFIPNVIVQWKSSYELPRQKLLDVFSSEKAGKDIAYVDAEKTAKSGYIRFKDEKSAEMFTKVSRSSDSFSARILPESQQASYWEKANQDRIAKLSRKKCERGSERIARKVFERNIATFQQKPSHIVFDEDEKEENENDKSISVKDKVKKDSASDDKVDEEKDNDLSSNK